MPAAPIPPTWERLEGRAFGFDPPILRVEPNRWMFRQATWSEVLVRNAGTGRDVWIPRRFVGELHRVGQLPAVRLRQQLELRDGSVWPHRRRVLEMPLPSIDVARPPRERHEPAPVIGIRLESRAEARTSRLAGGAIALGVLGCLAVAGYSFQSNGTRRAMAISLDRTYLALTASDDYEGVVRALGEPVETHWTSGSRGERFHILDYSHRGFRAVLLKDNAVERYIGILDEDNRVVQSVLLPLPRGGTSYRLLSNLVSD